MKSTRAVATAGSLLLVGGVLAMAGILKLLERNEFNSVATVRVNPYSPTPSGAYFILTEFETIHSQLVLSNVADSLDLNERWSKKYNQGRRLSESEIEERIKRRLDLRVVRNSQLIRVSVFDDDPYEAAQLANRITEQYRRVRMEQFSQLAAGNMNGPAKFAPVDIVALAAPELRPVRPNRYLGGFMLGCGIFLLIAGILGLSDWDGSRE